MPATASGWRSAHHQRDMGAHRVADDHHRRGAEAGDHRGDVVGVGADAERWRSIAARATAAEVDGDQAQLTIEVLGDGAEAPRVGGDAVHGDHDRGADRAAPAHAPELGSVDRNPQRVGAGPTRGTIAIRSGAGADPTLRVH